MPCPLSRAHPSNTVHQPVTPNRRGRPGTEQPQSGTGMPTREAGDFTRVRSPASSITTGADERAGVPPRADATGSPCGPTGSPCGHSRSLLACCPIANVSPDVGVTGSLCFATHSATGVAVVPRGQGGARKCLVVPSCTVVDNSVDTGRELGQVPARMRTGSPAESTGAAGRRSVLTVRITVTEGRGAQRCPISKPIWRGSGKT